jgi:hypothetical protein
MAVFVNKSNTTKYLTGNKIAEVLRSIAKAVHPDLTKEELKKFSPIWVEYGPLFNLTKLE